MTAPGSPRDALFRIAAFGDSFHDRELAYAALSKADRCRVDRARKRGF